MYCSPISIANTAKVSDGTHTGEIPARHMDL